MGVEVAVFVVFAVVIVVVVLVVTVASGQQRRAEAEQWAAQNGWQYVKKDRALAGRWAGPPFERGASRWTEDILYGMVEGRQAIWFTYVWATTSYDSSTNSTQNQYHPRQVMAWTLPAPLPELALMPETLGSKLKTAFGRGDIEVGEPEFDKLWQVHGDDEGLARHILQPDLRGFLMEHCQRCSFRVVGDTILLWQDGRKKIDELPWFRWRLTEIVRMLPADVWAGAGPVQDAPRQPGQTAEQWPVQTAEQWPVQDAPRQPGQVPAPGQGQGPQWWGTPDGPIRDA